MTAAIFSACSSRRWKLADYAGLQEAQARKQEARLAARTSASAAISKSPPRRARNWARIHFEADGTVTIITGTLDFGMGHATTYAQILTELLGIPFERIRMVEGDSDRMAFGGGSGGSRSVMFIGTALTESAAIVIERGKQIASHVLEASLATSNSRQAASSSPVPTARSVCSTWRHDCAAALSCRTATPNSLDVDHVVKDPVPSAFPNGCHIAEVEVDPETGAAHVVRYSAVNDLGTVVNPLLVEGQIQGGVVQGLGQALLEQAVYDSDGQLVTGSFMDYAMPRAHDAPMIDVVSHPVPTKSNPLGAKGCGEAGTSGGLPSVANAVIDALSDYGIRHLEMPMTPARIWQAIQDAKARQAS